MPAKYFQNLQPTATAAVGSPTEPYPHAVKAQHLDNGIVKSPLNVHGIYVKRGTLSGCTQIAVKQNEISRSFVLDDGDCRHLAALLSRRFFRLFVALFDQRRDQPLESLHIKISGLFASPPFRLAGFLCDCHRGILARPRCERYWLTLWIRPENISEFFPLLKRQLNSLRYSGRYALPT